MPPGQGNPSEHEKEKIERLRRAMYSRSLSDKLHDRERRTLDVDEADVNDDFVRPEVQVSGLRVAPRAISFARHALWWLLGGALIFFLGALGFFGYYFLIGGGSLAASPNNISITVTGSPQIEGWTPTELQVVVTNHNNAALELADHVITYPNGTRSPTDFSTPLESQRITLGTVAPGESRHGTVSAVFDGQTGEQSPVKVELEYRMGGSSAIFVASTSYTLVFSSSPLSIAIEGNGETISGQPVQITATVASNTEAPVRDVLLFAQYPFGFKLSSASPPPGADGLWHLGELQPGQ